MPIRSLTKYSSKKHYYNEETEEANGNGSIYLAAFAVGAAIGGAALGINKLLKIRKDRKIKKEQERFEKEVKDRLTANGFL